MKVTVIPIEISALGIIPKGVGQRELVNRRTGGDHPNYSIVEVG